MLRYCLFALLLAATSPAAVARDGDPLETPACRQAMDALQAAAAALPDHEAGAAQRQADLTALQGLRQRAARTCLGSTEDLLPGRSAQPPVTVPPPVIRAPERPAVSAPALPLPQPSAPPTTVTACDTAGCWASDGTRLQRVGPQLLGPRGVCSVHGALLHCP